MFRKPLNLLVFILGLAVVGWIAAGYAGSNALGLAVALVIGLCYLSGGFELYRYRQATIALEQSIDALSPPPPLLSDWLDRLPPSLRNPVRLRIEGERVALPGPALTPYLVGLLVLLGMLGTLLGMMATLRGTGIALESATDLQAIRESLAAPVKGLGFAFGTSIAGVAASAMLGLLSALCRRERLQAVQRLDLATATTLHAYSQTHQREETFRLLQRQTELMPTLVDRLQAMMTALEQQQQTCNDHLTQRQQEFQQRIEVSYAQLAASNQQALRDGIVESARAAAAALQPVAETTMAALTRETSALRDCVSQAVQRQLDGLASGFEASTTTVATLWQQALAEQSRANGTLAQDLDGTLTQFTATFEQRTSDLVTGVSARLDASAGHVAAAWNLALDQQRQLNQQLATASQQTLLAAAAEVGEHSATWLERVDRSHAALQTALAAQDQQRLTTWTEALEAMSAALNREWVQAGERAIDHQRTICETLERSAGAIATQLQEQANATLGEIGRLVQAAAQAPAAAAEVIAELRQKVSESMVRDAATLEERNRLMATLGTLLDTLSHAANDQRSAIDTLVATSAERLDRLAGRFDERIESEAGKLDTAAAQTVTGAVEIASLGEAFAVIVQQFGKSSDKLVARLQKVEGALDKSLARSDEQLAYYVAQAREVIDLSVLAQRQIIEELQQLASRQTDNGSSAA